MKARLQALSNRALALIKDPLVKDPAAMARLGPIPAKLQRMELQLDELEQEADQVEEMIESFSGRANGAHTVKPEGPAPDTDFTLGRRAAQTKLRIETDGILFDTPGRTNVISEHKASDSLVRWLTLLYETKGVWTLEKLSTLRVNRGPFVSARPAVDYKNGSKPGDLYQFQAIGKSGYHVLTTNTTQEKAENLLKAARCLGFAEGSVKVQVVEK